MNETRVSAGVALVRADGSEEITTGDGLGKYMIVRHGSLRGKK